MSENGQFPQLFDSDSVHVSVWIEMRKNASTHTVPCEFKKIKHFLKALEWMGSQRTLADQQKFLDQKCECCIAR